jgi:hypothetical protein
VAGFKTSNIKRRYETLNANKYDSLKGFSREEKLKELKGSLKSQRNFFTKHKTINENALKASFIISQMIIKKSKPFAEGEFIKDCILKACEVMCPEKMHSFTDISLSSNTVMRRAELISEDLKLQLVSYGKNFESFALALDESIDIKDVSQLSIFIRGISKDFEVIEELLEISPIFGQTRGTDIYDNLKYVLNEYELPLNKLVSVTTDGAPSMVGKNRGFVLIIKAEMERINPNNKLLNYHCIIHQESLCEKSANIKKVTNLVVEVVNKIRTRPLSHRKFQNLLQELNFQYGDVIYWSNVRWLSRGKVLKRFYDLKNEITLFCSENDSYIEELSSPEFNFDLAFLIDLTQYLNELNTKFLGKDHLVTDLYSFIKAFKAKLNLWEFQIKNNYYFHFV